MCRTGTRGHGCQSRYEVEARGDHSNLVAGRYRVSFVDGLFVLATVVLVGISLLFPGCRDLMDPLPEDVPDGFVVVLADTFTMGTPSGSESDPFPGDEPSHLVILTHDIYVDSTEVTNKKYIEMAQWACNNGYATADDTGLWDNLDGSHQKLLDLISNGEISFDGSSLTVEEAKEYYPVRYVTWFGAVAYCDWLSLSRRLPRAYDHSDWKCNGDSAYTADGYRLPTEAEWEFVCRAGSTTTFANGWITDPDEIGPDCLRDTTLDQVGWYCANSSVETHPVAGLQPNAWGLYDMHGNVSEWCNDRYADNAYYVNNPTNPLGGVDGEDRVWRGGHYRSHANACRSANRAQSPRDVVDGYYAGFRPVRTRPDHWQR